MFCSFVTERSLSIHTIAFNTKTPLQRNAGQSDSTPAVGADALHSEGAKSTQPTTIRHQLFRIYIVDVTKLSYIKMI